MKQIEKGFPSMYLAKIPTRFQEPQVKIIVRFGEGSPKFKRVWDPRNKEFRYQDFIFRSDQQGRKNALKFFNKYRYGL